MPPATDRLPAKTGNVFILGYIFSLANEPGDGRPRTPAHDPSANINSELRSELSSHPTLAANAKPKVNCRLADAVQLSYERAAPGELLHLDIKKLGRIERPGHRVTGDRSTQVKGSGWECVHVCIDDHSRVAFAQIKADQKRHTAVDFLEAALACYASLGVKVQRIMTDNGPCYHSAAFRKACSAHGLKHLFTKPYTPQTNGKAERFIQSSLREWAYARPYNHSDERAAALPLWLHRYNWHRPHRSLNRLSPITRLNLQDNLLTTHS